MTARSLPFAVLAACLVFLAPVPAAFGQAPAGDRLESARQLYGSAAYQEALDVLDRLKQGGPAAAESVEIEKSRALCLLALGRSSEARQVFAAILIAQPGFRLSGAEVSRRVLDTFRDVRRECLPAALTRAFQSARQAYEYQLWDDAARGFERVIALSQDEDMPADAGHAPDIAELARGYLDLLAAKRPPVPARPLAASAALPSAVQDVFDEHDREVTPPEPIEQRMPSWPAVLRSVAASGVIEVLIDESGKVIAASMRPGAHPVYDSLLLEAARQWRYHPARRGDAPVKYLRRIRIVNAPQAPDAPDLPPESY